MLNIEQEKVKELKNKLLFYEQNFNENINKIKELENLINIKNTELNNLNTKIDNDKSAPFMAYMKPGEKIMAINFVSTSQDIHKPMACKNTDIISRLEETLYNDYPQYKDYNTYLTVNGNAIKRFKSLDENGVKDGDSIIVNTYDEE